MLSESPSLSELLEASILNLTDEKQATKIEDDRDRVYLGT